MRIQPRPGSFSAGRGDHDPGDLVALLGDEPERSVEGRLFDEPVDASLVRLGWNIHVSGEGGVVRVVDAAFLSLAHRAGP
jgi:hypothetical protein